jgi:D-sedoheptulose 7-phosphate isomerase
VADLKDNDMLEASKQIPIDEAQIDGIFQREFEQHKSVVDATARAIRRDFGLTLAIMEQSVRQGGKLLFFGNGGSAADAQHIAAELVVRYKTDRRPIAAISLTTDTSTLTACGNDMGFEALFERQIEALGRPGDVAIGISTSGKSPNVLRGLRQARKGGLKTIGLSGGNGGEMATVCDSMITVPSPVTARIQEMHITIGHMLCVALETQLGLV